MAAGLFIIGLVVAVGCLWQLRQLLVASGERLAAGTAQMERLVEELVSTAEAASVAVSEQTEALSALLDAAKTEREKLAEHLSAAESQPVARPVHTPPAQAMPLALMMGAARQDEHRSPMTGESRLRLGLQPPKEIPPLHSQVYQLVDQGKPLPEVARLLKLSKGEVELILGLRRA